mmetsp:Transcript_14808/g.47231  ORF Transcript_14808/g.47231 Transcript_14808/m.47231 type:complete len:143 (-) Transcript_14808:233-661(-)
MDDASSAVTSLKDNAHIKAAATVIPALIREAQSAGFTDDNIKIAFCFAHDSIDDVAEHIRNAGADEHYSDIVIGLNKIPESETKSGWPMKRPSMDLGRPRSSLDEDRGSLGVWSQARVTYVRKTESWATRHAARVNSHMIFA